MVALQPRVISPPVSWTTGEALWPIDAASGAFHQPAILRFDHDSFIDEFLRIAQTAPGRFHEWRARTETWRTPIDSPSLAKQEQDAQAPPDTLTLYQSAHGRFYLVAASLICRIPSLPDKILDFRRQEKTFLVMRRLVRQDADTAVDPLDSATYSEHAFVDEQWRPVGDPFSLHAAEERIPLSPVNYTSFQGARRRMFTGLIPVSRRGDVCQCAPRSGHWGS